MVLNRVAPLAKTQKTGENPCKNFFGGNPRRHNSHTHGPSPYYPPTSITATSSLHNINLPCSIHIISSHIGLLQYSLPSYLHIYTNPPPESHLHHSLHHLSLLQHRPNSNSTQQKLSSPIYKTAHPSVLDYPSRNPTPDLPKPSLLANQSTNHTPCHHSQHSRVGCESRFYIMSRRFDPHRLKIFLAALSLNPSLLRLHNPFQTSPPFLHLTTSQSNSPAMSSLTHLITHPHACHCT